MIVVDASVAAKWLLPEAGEQEAQALLDGEERLAAPETIRIEVAGAVIKRYRTGTMDETDARSRCEFWQSLIDNRLHLLPVEGLFDQAMGLAFQLKHGLPDCLYLAAAGNIGAGLITADRTLFERGKAVHDRIQLLAGIDPH
ncbi:MAG: type II toxin-antitoxin system VapC family toxin [Candidatus Methylomirabilis oxygeniifera]|nr:MAG: type II toxin-antitoxin system VapC family toxin [Candidatus Methylomirabilis oxyfera]